MGDDGLEGLTQRARELLNQADIVIGGVEALQQLAGGDAEAWPLGKTLDEIVTQVARCTGQRAVILAQGDPLFYGTARFLCDHFGKEFFEVVPHVSSMQLAFARVKESWDEAYLTNLATQPLDRVVETIRTAERVGLFTTETLTPSVVAETLLDRRIDYFTAYVCENLGSPRECITRGDLAAIRDQKFDPLNVMVLVRHRGAADRPRELQGQRRFGNADEMFFQSRPKRGLLTPAEVRCIALAEMDLAVRSVVWDVGAGSGSLAIEAAMLAPQGQVFAIEMDAEDYGLMLENASAFDCPSLVPVHGQAPQAWRELPDPDAVFVGGAGRWVTELVAGAIERLKRGGRIVANTSGPAEMVEVAAVLRAQGIEPEVRMIQISRGVPQMDRMRLESLSPSFLIAGCKR
jgi:precorrin-6B C5,15-methyltransferase / cobalt-precorrin-6B C5,C15-methyltransferase